MNRKYIGIAIIIVGLIILAAVIYFVFFYKKPAPEPTANVGGNNVEETKPPVNQGNKISVAIPSKTAVINVQPQVLTPEEVKIEDLKRMAGSFAERFGSFSNQSDYGNIRDLKIFMTKKMQNWADKYIADAIAQKADTSSYYGVTSKAVTKESVNFDDDTGKAQILVNLQRREAIGTPNNATSFYQGLDVYYIKEAGVWRVDDAVWREK